MSRAAEKWHAAGLCPCADCRARRPASPPRGHMGVAAYAAWHARRREARIRWYLEHQITRDEFDDEVLT